MTDRSLEEIARAIHERYRINQRNRKPSTDPSMQPWERLSPVLQASNRDQAAAIAGSVQHAGFRIAPLDGPPVEVFTAEELEELARREHDRWVAERRAAGWLPGAEKDVERKRTPYLVPWSELTEEIREYDRDAVRAIPEVLRRARLGLYRS